MGNVLTRTTVILAIVFLVNTTVLAILKPQGSVSADVTERFGETAEEAVVREVFEETGRMMEIDRLGFVAEDYFICDAPAHLGKLVYEIGFYFYMKTPADFEPVCDSFTEDGAKEYLVWTAPEERRKLYPVFFNDELAQPEQGVKHFVTDQRE